MRIVFLILLFLYSLASFGQKTNQSVGFVENKGQIINQKGKQNSDVLYLLKTSGLNIQLRKQGFSYDMYEIDSKQLIKEKQKTTNLSIIETTEELLPNDYLFHRIDVDFIGSNKNVQIIADEKSKDFENFYTVKNLPQGVLKVYKYKKIIYKNLYNKIDVVFFIPEDSTKTVEYNFIIHPGGKISDVKMKFNGVKTALIDNKIMMNVRFGELEETLPMSWTLNDSIKEEVTIKYKKIKNNIYGFEGNYFSQKTLIIDPVPVRLWGTFYGGEGEDYASSIHVGPLDNTVVGGRTASTGNIATSGTHQNYLSGIVNGFIAKFDTNGNRLWATYYRPQIQRVKSDSNSNVYFCGTTLTLNDLATPGAHQTIKDRYNDVFIGKLNSSGTLEWATYYGGNSNEDAYAICFDSDDNVYIGGSTNSSTGISTPGSFQPTLGSSQDGNYYDGYIVKFNPAGNRIWATYFGGQFAEGFYSCAFSEDNFLYMVGGANSPNLSTPGSYQPNLIGRSGDGIIIKLSPDGDLIWSTYLGGNLHIFNCSLAGDNLYVQGRTFNPNIGTPGTFSPVLQNSPNAVFLNDNESTFIIKFNVQTQQKTWGTYFIEGLRSISVNSNDELYFSGDTMVSSGIATPGSFMPEKGPLLKSFMVKLNSDGQQLWGTYYGGENATQLAFLDIDSHNDIVLFGSVFGGRTGITTPGAHQSTLGSNPDTYLAKFRDCMSTTTISSNSPVCLGNTVELFANGGTSYSWTGPNGFVSTSQNPVILNATALNNGTYFCSITGSGACDDTVSINVIVGNTGEITPTLSILPTLSGNCNSITILPPTARDECNSLITGTTTSPTLFTTEGTYNIVWNYIDGNGTTKTQNQTVIVNSEPLPIVSQNPFLCQNVTHTISDLVKLSDIPITGQNLKWYDALTGGNILPLTTRLENGTTYYASQTISGCESARIAVSPTIQETPSPIGFAVQYFCDTETLTVQDLVVTGTDIVFYDDRYAGTVLPFSTPLVDGVIYWASQTINGCKSYVRLPVMVDILNGIPANDYQVLICDELNDGQENVALSSYNSNLITNTNLYSFEYYHTFEGANTGNASDKINDFDTFRLVSGENIVYVKIGMNALCFKIVALKLTVISSPVLAMKDIFSLCENNNVTIFADAGYRYLWSNSATTPSITVSTPGNYWVTVFKDHGSVICSTTKHFQVVISNKAAIDNISVQDWTANDNTISVFVSGDGDYEYSLDGVNYQTSSQFNGLASGEYRIYVNDKNGCGLTWKDLFLLMHPKFFTPNNDGVNDFWKIKFSSMEPELSVKIFDRYGKFIKEIGHDDIGWDGTYNNQPLPATDYWFVVTRANGNEHRGHFSLKR